jgi:isopentenyldiphosphate isomerase
MARTSTNDLYTTDPPGLCPIELRLNRRIITNLRRSWGKAAVLHYNLRMNAHIESLTLSQVQARLEALQPRLQQLPPLGSRPLTIAGRVCGWITARATEAVQELEGVRVEHEAVHVGARFVNPSAALNALLANVAVALKEAGCARGWRDELLDVVGEGCRLGVIERAAVRPMGLLTRAVHLNAWTPDGRLYVARRSATKNTDPDMLDTLVGGLAGAGENMDTALVRESYEEAGLAETDIAQRDPVRTIVRMHRRLPEGYQVEDVLVSECVLADSVAPRNIDGEVSEIMAVTPEQLWQLLTEEQFTLEASLVILDSLRSRLMQTA